MATDYYTTLGLSRGASEKDIKRAYRRLARQLHPDVNRDDARAEERFKEVQEAYRVLSDPKLREQYDRFGTVFESGGPDPTFAGAGPFGGRRTFRFSGGEAEFGDLGGFGDLFDGLFGGRRQRPVALRGRDAEVAVQVSLEEVDRGAERDLTLVLEDLCPTCGGGGITAAGEACRSCGGQGVQRRQESIRGLRIPAGVSDGEVIRARGRGGRGVGQAPAGDLLVRVGVRPHPFFERSGDDLLCELPIALSEAVLGAEIEVPTLRGMRPLRIPAGTQGGQRFRIKEYGLPNRRSGQRGSLMVRVNVVVPTELRPEERRLIEQIGARQADPRAGLWKPRSRS